MKTPNSMPDYSLTPIAYIDSPYKEKFAIPRQPGLVPEAQGQIRLQGEFNHPDCVKGLTDFSHIWLIFLFHQNLQRGWQPLVRPPRLGGNEKIGVLATRATHRPNGLGMSVVKLEGIREDEKGIILDVSGHDLLDQTPIVDIKPYIPYSDAVTEAKSGFVDTHQEQSKDVHFSTEALQQLQKLCAEPEQFQAFVVNVLSQDPRPAYRKGKADDRQYGISLADFNIRWHVQNNIIEVDNIRAC